MAVVGTRTIGGRGVGGWQESFLGFIFKGFFRTGIVSMG